MGAPTQSSRIVAGRYRLVRELGSGGMGTVWLAADRLLDREVAIKDVSPPLDVTEPERAVLRERTLREARTAARLSHPNVVTIYDVVEDGGRPWIVMELVPARSLRDIVAENGPLTPQRAAEVGCQVLAALGAAHSLGIMHRDVKPGNVLIDAGGRAVLADFGIARTQDSPTLTTSGVLVGSPSYIAPERARGERGSPESDLWSLGATLYAAVEGRPPYDRNGALATLTAVVTEEPDAPRQCGVLWPVISGLLARDPARRIGPAEAGEMLREVAGNGPGPQRTGPGPGPATAPMPGVLAGTSAMSGTFGMSGVTGTAEPAGTAAPEAADRSATGSASTLQNAERTLAFHPRVPLLPPLDGDGRPPPDGDGRPPPDEPQRPRARAQEPAPEQPEPELAEPELAEPELAEPELAEPELAGEPGPAAAPEERRAGELAPGALPVPAAQPEPRPEAGASPGHEPVPEASSATQSVPADRGADTLPGPGPSRLAHSTPAAGAEPGAEAGAQPTAGARPEPGSGADPQPSLAEALPVTPVLGEAPQAVAIPQPGRPAADLDVTAVRGAASMARPGHRRRRAGLLGGLLAVATAVGIFTALDTLGQQQPRAHAPSGTHHGSAAASRSARGSSATASTSPHAATPTAGSGGTGPAPAPGAATGVGSSAPVPAGYHRYQDPTGFSIAMPDGWQVSHHGHYVYLTPPSGADFLLIDQSGQPKSNPLADWRQQEANRRGTYPGYRRIRLMAIHYPQAEKAADWEFTYYHQGVVTHVFNRNILANSTHAYALYWSTPQAEWGQSWHIFQTLARTFQPAP